MKSSSAGVQDGSDAPLSAAEAAVTELLGAGRPLNAGIREASPQEAGETREPGSSTEAVLPPSLDDSDDEEDRGNGTSSGETVISARSDAVDVGGVQKEDEPTLMDEMIAFAEVARNLEKAKRKAEEENMDKTFGSGLEEGLKVHARRKMARAAEIEELKKKGNAAFKEKSFEQALQKYTEAIEMLKDKLLGKGWYNGAHVLFSNRSLVYLKLGKFEKALKDAERAISVKPMWTKGILRKIAAFSALGRDPEAQQCFESAISTLTVNSERSELQRRYKAMYPKAYEMFEVPAIRKGVETQNSMIEEIRNLNVTDDKDFLNEVSQDPIIMKGLKDPRLSGMIKLLATNPEQALREYGHDEEFKTFMAEYFKILSPRVHVESPEPAIESVEEKKVRTKVDQVLAKPEVKKLLEDGEVQKVLAECGDPNIFRKYQKDLVWQEKFKILQENGLIQFEAL